MDLKPRDFEYLCDVVREQAAIVISENKKYLVETRLAPLLRRERLGSFAGLVRQLRRRPGGELRTSVVEAMTTNETSFFRDEHPFEALRTRILPELASGQAGGPLRIWCGACSSGQEPYSIAMTVCEHFPALHRRGVHILATDLSDAVLKKARRGLYRKHEVRRGLPVALRDKYFDRQENGWQAREVLQDMVEFRPMNLIEPWEALPAMDVVFLRNVLIYFDAATKRSILAKIRRVLEPGGYLFLGSSETTLNLDDAFERVTMGAATGYRLKEREAVASR